MVKVPKLKLPKLVTTRESGEKAFLDLTLTEWGISLLVIVALYVLVVGYFIALLEISKVIRNSGNTVSFFHYHFF